jgi:hypothetical protein
MKKVECGKWNTVVIKVLQHLKCAYLFPHHLFFSCMLSLVLRCVSCVYWPMLVCVSAVCLYIPILKSKILCYCIYVLFNKFNVYLHLQSIKLVKQPLKFNRQIWHAQSLAAVSTDNAFWGALIHNDP